MELVSQIINELMNTNEYSLDSALLKTKVLASRIQNKELLEWANSELIGYESIENLPEYRRKIPNGLNGDYINGNIQYTNQQIPTTGLPEKIENSLRFVDFTNSVKELESFCYKEKTSIIKSPLRAEIVGLINNNWSEMGNPYLNLYNVNRVISKTSIEGILSNVRNKLLDFMLKIDEQFGNLTEIKDLRDKNTEITKIVNNTIINNNGDGNVLNTGNNNSIENKPKIQKNSIEELANELQKNKVPEQDILELIEIIQNEQPLFDENKFGNKVNTWIAKMVSKTVDGTWNVGIGMAGNILATAIQNYYGM
ncbi:AbiTii domain-containing protein [Empedobacter falsenii]|uniref:AbiTii domain-containing protein n=1 Tax=Empedobacter falsenii TaxID=343874 RepID=A0A376GI74_9FLAO|nr:hypothetical protein [Empedobacter falsenii]STD59670.1 Uncharacterised protein [Empedobacter falsenii]